MDVRLRVESKPKDSEARGNKLHIPKIYFWCMGMYNFGIILVNTSIQFVTVTGNKTICKRKKKCLYVRAHMNLELRQHLWRMCVP